MEQGCSPPQRPALLRPAGQHRGASGQQSPAAAQAGQSQQQPDSVQGVEPAHGTAAQLSSAGAPQEGAEEGGARALAVTDQAPGRGAATRVAYAVTREDTTTALMPISRTPAAQQAAKSEQQSPLARQRSSQQQFGVAAPA